MNPYKPKVKAPNPQETAKITNILQKYALTTVCEKAACPNRSECYGNKSATFMILGDICTRACRFCNVKTGKGKEVDHTEPSRLANAVKELDLDYVVITSVDRDDLKDYGSSHFLESVEAIRQISPKTKIELLTPDFKSDKKALDTILQTDADKLAHNQETVKRLSSKIRPQSSYEKSLKTLHYYFTHTDRPIKSSLMLGLGEKKEEIIQTMQDLLDVGVSQLTLGQYLQPTPKHHEVIIYYKEEFFDEMGYIAKKMGFEAVASGALVRSSYNADKLNNLPKSKTGY